MRLCGFLGIATRDMGGLRQSAARLESLARFSSAPRKEASALTSPDTPAGTTVHAGGRRPTPRELMTELRDVAVAALLAVAAPALRPWHTRWGATDDEVAAPMPGDALVPGCQVSWTRAITIDAPPDAVWPWLAQAGFGKAGFYSNDLLDNAAHPSAGGLLPEFQRVHVGDWVPMFSRVDNTTAFKVQAFARGRFVLWAKPDSTWSWTLAPLAGGRTRLLTRIRQRYDARRRPSPCSPRC
jgi:hypothetical protein